jgi:hypothetical protein
VFEAAVFRGQGREAKVLPRPRAGKGHDQPDEAQSKEMRDGALQTETVILGGCSIVLTTLLSHFEFPRVFPAPSPSGDLRDPRSIQIRPITNQPFFPGDFSLSPPISAGERDRTCKVLRKASPTGIHQHLLQAV